MKDISLKAKLFILVLVTIVPMIVLHSVIIAGQYKHSIEMELKSSEDYAQAVSVAYTNYLDKIWLTEFSIGSSILENPPADAGKIQEYLKKCVAEEPTVINSSWCTPNGIVIAAVDDRIIGMDASDREYFRRITSGEDKVVSDLLVSRASSNATFIIARAIRIDGVLKGVVTMAVDVNKISLVLPSNRLEKTSSFGLVDKHGMLVYANSTPDLPYDKRHIKDDAPAWKALRGEVARVSNYIINDGTPRLLVSVPITKVGWAAFASITTQEVLKKSYSNALSSIIVMLLIILFSFALSLYLVINILKPVEILGKAAKAISSRDYTVRTNFHRKDELGQTGLAFDQMIEQIQELEISRQLFLQTAAHELRNPMTSIKGITSLIRRRVDSGKSFNNSKELLETLENEVSRLSRLLNKILEAFRVQRENIEIKANLSPIDMTEVVNAVVKPFKMDTSNNRSIIIESAGPAQVFGDFERLADVVRNFIDNAMKYSEEMTVINIKTYFEGDNVIVSVKDQGIGIPEDKLNKIFDSFYRAKNMEAKDPGGMGLGLYICKDIILRHGGHIWAENNKDKGSTFYIKLPLYKA